MAVLSPHFRKLLVALLSVLLAAHSYSSLPQEDSGPGSVTMSWTTASAESKTSASSGSIQIAANADSDDSPPSNGTDIPSKHNKKLGGYYPSYNGDVKPPSEIPYKLYDELLFFVATTKDSFEVGLGDLNQTEWDSLAHQFVDGCNKNHVAPLYSLGGWTGSRFFSTLIASAENRTAYARSITDFGKKYGFVGVDIDWEYPGIQGIGCNTISDKDVENLQHFLKEIKTVWPDGKLSCTGSIAGIRAPDYSRLPAANISTFASVVDTMRIMAYDVYGSFTKTTGPNAPLHATCAEADNQLSVETAIDTYLSQGFSPSQLSLGIPAYAKSWTLTSPDLVPKIVQNRTTYYYQNFTGIPAGGQFDDKPGTDVCGQPTGNGGTWLVSEMVEKGFLDESLTTGQSGFVRYYDDCSGEPFLVRNTTFISYDDTASTVKKIQYAVSKNLSGVFFFDTTGPLKTTLTAARNALDA